MERPEENFIDLKIKLPVPLQSWFIFLFAATFFLSPIAIVLLIVRYVRTNKILRETEQRINEMIPPEYRTSKSLEEIIARQKEELDSVKKAVEQTNAELQDIVSHKERVLSMWEQKITTKQADFNTIAEKVQKEEQTAARATKRAVKMRELYKSMVYATEQFFEYDAALEKLKIPAGDLDELEAVSPTIMLKLHCMDMKDLRKAYRDNDKLVSKVLDQYAARYTTKANKSIYSLMVIALRSELQNVLTDLKLSKLEDGIENIKKITAKYLKIASDGNQSIAGTLTKFIGEIEYLFISAAKIEYNYYVKKEQARQEQIEIRERIRVEAAERKALAEARKRIENEEAKYETELAKVRDQLEKATGAEMDMLNKRILELQAQLSEVQVKKDDIARLEHGKAGTVYVISNLGSFGDDVFKIGMTRRLEPQERINELGSASVPFTFDVHSFIFSEDAVALESKMHELLNAKRLNKVNLRKEFFKVSIDELEKLVNEIEPTAEFNKTMVAEEYRQSLSCDAVYTTDYAPDDDEDEEE
ncbi:MAG: GIY-YIG nuclease family protein [Treponema sp.]|nr:GIY-YIG nuclease family protein [Treponema sp.]